MDLSTAKEVLTNGGFVIDSEERLGNETGKQLRLGNGAIVNVFDKGSYSIQGRNREQVEELLDNAASGPKDAVTTRAGKKILSYTDTIRLQRLSWKRFCG